MLDTIWNLRIVKVKQSTEDSTKFDYLFFMSDQMRLVGEVCEDLVAQCRAGMNMTTPTMTPAARLQLVMNAISPQAVAGKAGTTGTEDVVSTSAGC